jgi:hypothetical protein
MIESAPGPAERFVHARDERLLVDIPLLPSQACSDLVEPEGGFHGAPRNTRGGAPAVHPSRRACC